MISLVNNNERSNYYVRYNDRSRFSTTVKGIQIAVSLLKSSAHAQQSVAEMLMQNTQRGTEMSQQSTASSPGRIDIYA